MGLTRCYKTAVFFTFYCLFTPIFRGFWGHIFPKWRHLSSWPPKGTSLRGNTSFEAWAIKRENRFNDSTWAQDREKKDRTGQSKSHKGVIFHLLGEKSPLNAFLQNLHSICRPRRNHVCQLLSWNFQLLRFYRGSNFTFSYWFFHGPYNSTALLRCLWLCCTLPQ